MANAIALRDCGECVYCGATGDNFEVDHVRPGSHFPHTASPAKVNAPTNLVLACERCNRMKGPQDLPGFARMLRGRGVPAKEVNAMLKRVRAAVKREVPEV